MIGTLRMIAPVMLAIACVAPAAAVQQPLQDDAIALEGLINRNYAYLDRLPGGRFALTGKLRAEVAKISDKRELVRFSERALMLLADHHAITGSSMRDSWSLFPSYGDLWIARRDGRYVVDQVRGGSPAEKAGVLPGDMLAAVGDVPIDRAVAEFWDDLGTTGGGERDPFAARVLAAGRRDRERDLTFIRGKQSARRLRLPNLYQPGAPARPLLDVDQSRRSLTIRINDSLGEDAVIPEFDRAMAGARPGQPILIDLTDTPSGGNTTVARAIMGWFVSKPTFYQIHNLPAEQRQTGIARQWAEQVLPRKGKHHRGPVKIRVGRWTGSMGEGLAIGFDAIGARVEGTPMAGLLGAIYDHPLSNSGLIVKIPTERLFAVDGTPREKFVPEKPTAANFGSPIGQEK